MKNIKERLDTKALVIAVLGVLVLVGLLVSPLNRMDMSERPDRFWAGVRNTFSYSAAPVWFENNRMSITIFAASWCDAKDNPVKLNRLLAESPYGNLAQTSGLTVLAEQEICPDW